MVTIVIPYQNTCPERERNFNFIIGNIKALKIPCVIAQQTETWELDPSPTISDQNITHFYLPDDGLFKKSKLINMAAKHCLEKYIWILDADVFLDFNNVIKNIEDQDVIKPFFTVDHFCEEKTRLYTTHPSEGLGNHEQYQPMSSSDYFGKYSVILKKEIFDSVGGFNEEFEGWGWEDIDFIHNRINKLDPKVHTIESSSGVHLYHPEASRINERRNFYLYRKNFDSSNKKLSFCIHIKNRIDQLKQTLQKNLDDNRKNQDSIEFVLTDMGSSDFASEWIISNFEEDLLSGYLKLNKVFDFPFWHASICKNTAHYHGEGDILVNLDCDNFTGENGGEVLIDIFEDEKIVAVHQFCESDWLDGSYGRISIRKEIFHELGGYDESFLNMGFQDTDLVKRIKVNYPDGVFINTDSRYNQAIANDKNKSIENTPPEIKAKGFSWMESKNKELSKKNIESGLIVANDQIYGVRDEVRFYSPESNQFKKFNT